jgi:hypothetical protein
MIKKYGDKGALPFIRTCHILIHINVNAEYPLTVSLNMAA